jgi:hypothetical protein
MTSKEKEKKMDDPTGAAMMEVEEPVSKGLGIVDKRLELGDQIYTLILLVEMWWPRKTGSDVDSRLPCSCINSWGIRGSGNGHCIT